MITFIADKDRFLEEFQNHIAKNPLKYVNWYTDGKLVHLFITTTSEVFYSTVDVQDIPNSIQSCLSRKGEVLGIKEPKPAKIDVGMNQLVSHLKYSQVKQ